MSNAAQFHPQKSFAQRVVWIPRQFKMVPYDGIASLVITSLEPGSNSWDVNVLTT